MATALGVDWGERRIGLAICDLSLRVPVPLEVIDAREAITRIVEVCRSRDVRLIFIGLPLGLNGQHTRVTEATLSFRDRLEEALRQEGLEAEIVLVDERMSSKAIERAFMGAVKGGEVRLSPRERRRWREEKHLLEALEILSLGLEVRGLI